VLGGVLPPLLGAALPPSPWAAAWAAGVAGFAAAASASNREDDSGLRRTMALAAGASLAALFLLAGGAHLWPPGSVANRAALCAIAAAAGLAMPALTFDCQRLEWWYVLSALVALSALCAAAFRALHPLWEAVR
jgi:hypothetical protein